MFKLLRLVGMLCALVSVALAAALLQPEWASDLSIKKWSLSASPHGPPSWEGPTYLPAPETPAVNRRIQEKQRVIGELLDGRRTFFETAAIFRRLNDEYPKLPPYPNTPGDSDEERICWQVLIWVRGTLRLQGNPEEGIEAVSARFENQLRDYKKQHGTVCLPDLAAME
jgi:hypothetical protein